MNNRKAIHHKIEPGSIGYFNFLRGLGIILVIAGHSYSIILRYIDVKDTVSVAKPFSNWGEVFGTGIMSMLFVISGYGFFKRRPKKCWSIQKKLLIYPYITLAISVLLSKGLLAILEKRSFVEHGGEYILTYLLGLNYNGGGKLFGFPVESVGLFWFVLALFVGWNIYNGICQSNNEKKRVILVIASVLIGYGMSCLSSFWPYMIHVGAMVTGYLAVGEAVRKTKWMCYKITIWEWIILLGISGICLAYGNSSMYLNIWKLGLLDYLGSICIALLFFRYYAQVMDMISQNTLVKFVESVGMKSIYIITIHCFESIIFPWYRIAIFCGMRYGKGRAKHLVVATVVILLFRTVVIIVLYQFVMMALRWKKKWKKNRKKQKEDE